MIKFGREFLAVGKKSYICAMIRRILIIMMLAMAMVVKAQETLLPDSVLHLPPLNSLGQMHYINRWPGGYGFMGYHNWDLHSGLNMSLGASVFAGLGKHSPSGAGFAQNVSGMYAMPFNDKLSFAMGGYLVNANWGGFNLRDAGMNLVLGYKFNERWEGYLYGQKSLMRPKVAWPYYDMHELGDRIGAALKYNFSPSVSIQVSVEEHRY